MANEELNLQIPVLKNTLNFPNETNYILRNYSLFEIQKISQSEIGVACDIIQKHLENTYYFILNRQRIESSIIKNSIKYFEEELKFILNIKNLIKNLEIHQQDEIGNHIKKKAHIEREIEKYKQVKDKGEIELNNNEEDKELNTKIENIRKEISETIQQFNQHDLSKAFKNLSVRKDMIEISVFTTIINLLERTKHVEPKNIKKLMENFTEFTSRISQFDPRNLDINFALEIKENISHIFNSIHPKISKDEEKVQKYSYLMNFSRCAELAVNLVIILQETVKKAIFFSFSERNSLSSSNILSNLIIQNEENKLSPSVQNENLKINQIFDELKYFEDLIQKNITIDKDILNSNENFFFKGFNYFLSPEEIMINDLYIQFQKDYYNNNYINYKSIIGEPQTFMNEKNKKKQTCLLKFCNWYCINTK